MGSKLFRLASVAAGLAAVFVVLQTPTLASAGVQATAAMTGTQTSVPYGWVDFCQRYDGECAGPRLPAVNLALTPKRMRDIKQVNRWVNSHIIAVSDFDHWGLADRWDYPIDGKGDCEDYALLKRKMLMELGVPRQALLMTVVKDGNDDGHAILSIKTDQGDFVLDNLNDEVKPWNAATYRFVKRQSQEDPNVWVAIAPAQLALRAPNK